MAGNQRLCNMNQDHITAGRATCKCSCIASADDPKTAPADGADNSNNSNSSFTDELDEGTSDFFGPLPVCTSTPRVERSNSKSECFDSVVKFLTLGDSGLGDTLNSSPSVSDTASPSVSDTFSLSVSDTASPFHTETKSSSVSVTKSESDRKVTVTSCLTSPSVCTHKEQLTQSYDSQCNRISSTPICHCRTASSQLGQSLLFSGEKCHDSSDSPVIISSFQADFNLHRHSEQSISLSTAARNLHHTDKHSGSHLSWQEEEEDTDDEAYHSSSRVLTESPSDAHTLSLTSDLAKEFSRILKDLSPVVPDRLIGRKVGVEFVDIVGELYDRNIPASGVITWLTPYLSPADLIRMGGVCQRWRTICLENPVISKYRKLYSRFYTRSDDKENVSKASLRSQSPEELTSFTRATVRLGSVQRKVPVPTKLVFSSPDLYAQARKTLRWEDIMRHCPFCHSVAKILSGEDRGKCQNQQCEADFCTRCLTSYHEPNPCPALKNIKTAVPCSKKSKKSLKRISHL